MTKDQLTQALDDAHTALASAIASANLSLLTARRMERKHPGEQWPADDRRAAAHAHWKARHTVENWLAPEQARAVRAQAARFVRRDLQTSRGLHPRAFPARPVLALAA